MISPELVGDLYWDNVRLLMSGDSLDDISSLGLTTTATAGVLVDTSFPRTGTGSIKNESLSGNLTVLNAEELSVGNSDFTLEFFLWIDGTSEDTTYFMTTGPTVYFSLTGSQLSATNWGGYSGLTFGVIPESEWVHVAITRVSSTLRSFLNGELKTQVDIGEHGMPPFAGFGVFGVPGRPDLRSFVGKIEGIRLTADVGRYKEPFTPSDGPFPNFGVYNFELPTIIG